MHLHAWNSPPDYTLPAGSETSYPYLVEYPEAVLRDKVATMTDLLEDRFGVKMRSHRAGRWAFAPLRRSRPPEACVAYLESRLRC